MNVHMNPPPAKKGWGFCGSGGFVSCVLSLSTQSIYYALAELPALIRPLGLEPRLLLAGQELRDRLRPIAL